MSSSGANQFAYKNDSCNSNNNNNNDTDNYNNNNKEYIESLEREVGLKRILEQNLRDLQSQYYEVVRELDEFKSSTEIKTETYEKSIVELEEKLEALQVELDASREQSSDLEKNSNDIKESSQLLEKKYHRAKKIIKDMQSREQSFTRREQLYQQKLDEIEYELGVLIETVCQTVNDDGLKFFRLLVSANGNNGAGQDPTAELASNGQARAQLNVFSFLKKMLDNFNSNEASQNQQIKQRVVSILEQKLISLMASNNNTTTVVGNIATVNGSKRSAAGSTTGPGQNDATPEQSIEPLAASIYQHQQQRPLSQVLPLGVTGSGTIADPTRLFHAMNSLPTPQSSIDELLPKPISLGNLYTSTNSLESNGTSNNNNSNHVINNNNHNGTGASNNGKSLQSMMPMYVSPVLPTAAATQLAVAMDLTDDKAGAMAYQSDEWHDKPVSEWTTTQVSTWLLALGLDQYISKFEDRNVNGQSLVNLDSTVLKGLGVLNQNDRNLLKKKIRELRVEMEKERKLVEKRMKSKANNNGSTMTSSVSSNNDLAKQQQIGSNDVQHQTKSSWKRGLLS